MLLYVSYSELIIRLGNALVCVISIFIHIRLIYSWKITKVCQI